LLTELEIHIGDSGDNFSWILGGNQLHSDFFDHGGVLLGL
jgi:hypothetical protein